MVAVESALYEGVVRHCRFHPVENSFHYPLFMVYLDLSELQDVFAKRLFWSHERPNIAYLKREDHLGDPAVPLDTAVRTLVKERTGNEVRGPVRLLTHLRYFGHCFNPVSFFYCFDPSGEALETIVAEINNTPWHEQHCNVLTEEINDTEGLWKHYRFQKDFHVSPFMDMNMEYDWRFLTPGKRIQVHMQNIENERKLFDAILHLRRTAMTGRSLARMLLQYPAMTLQVAAKIYFQALKLHLKGATFYTHPAKRSSTQEESK